MDVDTIEPGVNSVNQLAHAAETAGQDCLLAQVSEEAFD
jgi:hypothetical protein